MDQHTPGPWRVDKHNDKWVGIWGQEKVRIALVDWTDPDILEANARLMAAAPALLAAAKAEREIIDWWLRTSRREQNQIHGQVLDDFIAKVKDARNQADAAIAQAEGRLAWHPKRSRQSELRSRKS